MRLILGSTLWAGAAALTTLAGCASGGGPSTTDVGVTPVTQQVTLATQQTVRISRDQTTVAVSSELPIGPDSAYALLIKVYGDLNVVTNTVDSRQRLVGNAGLKIRRRLGGESLVKYVDCGNKDGAPNAESYDLVLNLISSISPGSTPAKSVISTRIDGVATHPVFGSQTMCSTTGELEKRIATMVQAKAAK